MNNLKRFLITGGAGFIGSAVIRIIVNKLGAEVLNLDKLTYAGNLEALAAISGKPNYSFVKGDVCDRPLVQKLFRDFQPDVVMHLAAESHVDRSIERPDEFLKTNVLGTYTMLDCALEYWKDSSENRNFRFHHISTDEVYGSLGEAGSFTESTAYDPSSPYSASKASSDHLVRAWFRTYGLPILVTNCSNNYGPYQFPEKLIPLTITNALSKLPIPVYGDGTNIRDWLNVNDHANALLKVIEFGRVGETYNIGGNAERKNIDVIQSICAILDHEYPKGDGTSYSSQISFVEDRKGHDRRYAVNCEKIMTDLAWKQELTFEAGLKETVRWYIQNEAWWTSLIDRNSN